MGVSLLSAKREDKGYGAGKKIIGILAMIGVISGAVFLVIGNTLYSKIFCFWQYLQNNFWFP